MELVSPNDCIVNQLDTSTLFDETQIETNHLYLSKIFLGDIDFLKVHFDECAWLAVTKLVEMVVSRYVRAICKQIAQDSSIECSRCSMIFHHNCKAVTNHFKKNPRK